MAAVVKKTGECVGLGSESKLHRIAPRMALHRDGRNEAVLGCDQGSRFLSWIVVGVEGLEMLLPVFVLPLTLVRNDWQRVKTLAHIVIAVTTIHASEFFVRASTRPFTRDSR